jgi:hypothetical protein
VSLDFGGDWLNNGRSFGVVSSSIALFFAILDRSRLPQVAYHADGKQVNCLGPTACGQWFPASENCEKTIDPNGVWV